MLSAACLSVCSALVCQSVSLSSVARCLSRVGQNRIYTPYMTVYLMISLPKIPYIHRIYMVLANPMLELFGQLVIEHSNFVCQLCVPSLCANFVCQLCGACVFAATWDLAVSKRRGCAQESRWAVGTPRCVHHVCAFFTHQSIKLCGEAGLVSPPFIVTLSQLRAQGGVQCRV
jgi:hypothetical protein